MNIKIKKNIIFLIAPLFLFSCSETPESLLESSWAVESFYYMGDDIFDEKMLINMMSFRENNVVSIPKIGDKLRDKKYYRGYWEYRSDKKQLLIKSKSKYLNDTFDTCFTRDPEYGSIKMILQSEDVYMVAVRMLRPLNDEKMKTLPLQCK